MKTKATLRLGLLLLCTSFVVCCKGTETEPPTIQTSSIAPSVQAVAPEITSEASPENAADAKTQVYICRSAGAKRYHFRSNCRGIKRCTHEVAKVSVETAKGYGLTVCGYEK